MIKISIRDSFADLPPSILKKRIKEIEDRQKDIRNTTGYNNYTPEIRTALRDMHIEGFIESHPILDSGGDIVWVTSENAKDGDYGGKYEFHRPNKLPAVEFEDGKRKQIWENDRCLDDDIIDII